MGKKIDCPEGHDTFQFLVYQHGHAKGEHHAKGDPEHQEDGIVEVIPKLPAGEEADEVREPDETRILHQVP